MNSPVVVFSTNVQWDGHWYGAQHLGSRLSGRGFRVLLLEVPVSVMSPLRNPSRFRELIGHRLRVVSPTLAVDRPLGIPPQDHPRTRSLNARLSARRVSRVLARLDWPDPAIVLGRYMYSWRLASAFPRAEFVANLSDAATFGDATVMAERTSTLRSAQAAVCVSQPLVQEAVAAGIETTLLLPQGADVDLLVGSAERGPAPDIEAIPRPRIGLLGHLTTRVDFDLVRQVASSRPDWQFVFVGGLHVNFPELKSVPLEDLPNVHLLGERSRHEVGRYLVGFDAAWVPYAWNDFNIASNPLKVLEYLSVGVPVVAPAFPAVRDLGADVSPMEESSSAADWVEALEAAMQRDTEEARQHRRSGAAANTWDARADELASFLRDLV